MLQTWDGFRTVSVGDPPERSSHRNNLGRDGLSRCALFSSEKEPPKGLSIRDSEER